MSNWLRSPPGHWTASGSASPTINVNSKGSYSEIIASTPHDASGMMLVIGGQETSTDRSCLIDVAVGAASSEQVIVENLLFTSASENYRRREAAFIPISIPAGTRISARGQRTGGATAEDVRVRLLHGGSWADDSFSLCHTMGANTADSGGAAITPGASYGSYVQLSASTPFDCEAILVALGNRGANVSQADGGGLQIAVGAASSEQLILQTTWNMHSVGEAFTPNFTLWPLHIPAGTRVSARASGSFTNAFDLCLYGFC